MSGAVGSMTVGELVARLAEKFPLQWAEPWDKVGMVAGDRDAPVRSVLVTLDADRQAVRRATECGCDVLLTHHPATLDVSLPLSSRGPGAVLFDAVRKGVALVSFHTNLDRAPAGAEALPRVLGLGVVKPLEASEEPVVIVTTYVPLHAAEAVRAALKAAGAGRVGLYSGCSFTSEGTGRFTPGEGTSPSVGESEPTTSDEVRVEVVCAPSLAAAAMSVVRESHPYEEPVITAVPGEVSRGAARLGRLCELDPGASLGDFARRVGDVLGVMPRVWGNAESPVHLVGVGNGSAGSLVQPAVAAGADVLLAGEVRYHDARAALDSGLAVIEAGHDATEWPLVRVLADAVRDIVGSAARIVEEDPAVGWWTSERV